MKAHFFSTDFYEVPLCAFSFDLPHSCSLLSSSAGPLCADGFSLASSSALFLSHSVYSLNDLVHSQELSCTFTWLPHRSELLSQIQIHRLDAYSLDFSMDAAHPTSNPPFVFLPVQMYYFSWFSFKGVTLLSFLEISQSFLLPLLSVHPSLVSACFL